MNPRECSYTAPGSYVLDFKLSGRVFAFCTHTFETNPIAAAVVEDRKTGRIVIVPATSVRFTIPGNEDK